METYDGSDKLGERARGCVMTIGNFDGLHLGHRALLDAVVERARALGRAAAVFTFDRHPRRVLQPELHIPRLMSRGNVMTPPPSMCCDETTVSNRVNESKLLTLISGSSGSDRTGVDR